MCGIVGIWSKSNDNESIINKMAAQIRHRGPDDSGFWLDHGAGLAFAHRRLSIIDLSYAGHQPMISSCGRFVLCFNGEIYNHLEMRKQLQLDISTVSWEGHSDTETLLVGLQFWGIEKTLEYINGMFAFSLWDRKRRTLCLARDRMGEKPLYYGINNGTFMFGSELKALKAHPSWKSDIDRSALTSFLRYSYVPTPFSIYRGIYKLQPAHYIVIKEAGKKISEPICYWDLNHIARLGSENPCADINQLTDNLEKVLLEAVSSRMASDVPLGAFLSGGYDSSIVTALLQSQSNSPVKTFTIGYQEDNYNESKHALEVAKYLGTDHTELIITPNEAMNVIPQLPKIWDEPFADSSQIPTILISQLARKDVTVSLSGDGGDELFCGYSRYNQGYNAWSYVHSIPHPIRKFISHLLRQFPGATLESVIKYLPEALQIPHASDRLPKLADVISAKTGKSYYRQLVSHSKQPASLVIGGSEPYESNYKDTIFDEDNLREYMMYLDSKTYLPDDILTKVDRASMAVGLEARVPLLDHRVVEFSWRIPTSFKSREGKGKWILREVLYRHVPKELMDRPKMGFGAPIEHWLKGGLREWAESLLDETRLKNEGYLEPEPIRKLWEENASGRRRWHYHLWDILMFQAWLEEQSK